MVIQKKEVAVICIFLNNLVKYKSDKNLIHIVKGA
jgi:hypothetical protein